MRGSTWLCGSRLLARFTLSALLLAVGPVFGSATTPMPGASEVAGRALASLRRSSIESLRVYAVHGGKMRAIPFQIDERDARNRWSVTRHGQVLKPDESAGRIDDNDVLVVMNRDLGTRRESASLPEGATAWVEIRVGPEASPRGFAYVGSFPDPPARSTTDYVRYDAGADRIVAQTYEVTFGAPLPTDLRFANGKGNAVRAVKASGEARFFGGLFKLRRSEKDILAELEGASDGPIRVIRPAKYRIALPMGFRATARVNLVFYRDFVVGQATVRIKIPPRLVPADGELVAYFEFIDESGARVFLGDGPAGDPVDGLMSDSDRAFAGKSARWAALLLPTGRAFLVVVRPEGSLRKLDQRLFFRDGSAKPAFGFELAGIHRLETGEHDLFVNVMLLESTVAAEVKDAAAILREPPPVATTEIRKSAVASAPGG